MVNKRVMIAAGVIAVLILVVAGVYVFTLAGNGANGDLIASGFIEAEEVQIAAELGGRVLEILVAEGDVVEPGQVLVRLDGELLDAQIAVAQAELDVAQALLDQVVAGARPEQIEQAQAALVQAEAGRDGAYQAWQDLIALRENPQELDAQIALARAQVTAAEAALDQANALRDVAQIANDDFGEAQEQIAEIPEPYRPSLPLEFHLIPNAYWRAWVGVNTAQANLDGARQALNNLYAMRNQPQELDGQIIAAEARYRAAEAQVAMAQAQLDALQAGATAEQIATAEAQVAQAEAALEGLLVQWDKQTIVAPVGGVVLSVAIYEGELAVPGGVMLTVGDLDEVTLTVYVPEDRLGQVSLGQAVDVSVDSFPGRTFDGRVVAIADEAEFTPRNVQTQEERVNMVFAVDVLIPNPDHLLKPGVPGDVVFVMEVQ